MTGWRMPVRLHGLCAMLVVLVASLLLGACASTPERTGTYTVKRGDTLFSIGRRLGYDYRELARWNGIGRDYVIYPGQVLKLHPRAATRDARAGSSRTSRAAGTGGPRVPAGAGTARPLGPPVKWQWPVPGGTAALTARPNGGHGLTITGRLGEEVRAAGPGRVVYTGTGLLGYGQLVIIKHNETYLSAYGHTQSVAIREGDAVSAGQRIATMGAGPQGAPMLYFEIRVHGEPHNPLTLLPQR